MSILAPETNAISDVKMTTDNAVEDKRIHVLAIVLTEIVAM